MKSVSYNEIVRNPPIEREIVEACNWFDKLDYKGQQSRIERHLQYAVVIADKDIVYLHRIHAKYKSQRKQ